MLYNLSTKLRENKLINKNVIQNTGTRDMINDSLNEKKFSQYNYSKQDSKQDFCWRKFSNSWVALNPNPKGIIQFIGSFIFGSFPLNSYKYLLQNLFEQGYTIIVFRFPFTPLKFNHWQVATNLLKEEYTLRVEIIRFITQNFQKSHHNLEIYLQDYNYYWLGHSLGCKYISLLEILSNDYNQRQLILKNCIINRLDEKLISLINSVDITREKAEQEISKLVNRPINISKYFIANQPSILLAPEISNTVTVNGFTLPNGKLFSNFEGIVYPSGRETKCMIAQSKNLFNLTGIISFTQDCIARDDVAFLLQELSLRNSTPLLHKELFGWHFEPNGIQIEDLGTYINSFLLELKKRISY